MVRILIIILLLAIFIIDIKSKIIPNILNILLMILAILYQGFDIFTIKNSIIGAGLYILPLVFIYGYASDFYKKEVLGFGDIKLVISLGYILGYTNFFNLYLFYMISFILASIVGIFFILKYKNNEIAFAPFLIISFFYFFMWR